MKSEYIVALIGAIGTIASPILTNFVSERSKTKVYRGISDIRKGIKGKWHGTIHQFVNDGTTAVFDDFPIEFNFEVNQKKIIGESDLNFRGVNIELVAEGYFPAERHLLLTYRNKSDIQMQFGSIVMELNAEGNELEGKYVGYGNISERIIQGIISLKKK